MAEQKLKFGTDVKLQFGRQIKEHIAANFASDAAAAKDLGISRQRLHSYTSGMSLPRATILDRMSEKWGLRVVGVDAPRSTRTRSRPIEQLDLLFKKPVTFENDQLRVVLQKNGSKVVARIQLRTIVEVA